MSALEEAEAALAMSTPNEPAEGGKVPEMAETCGNSNLEVPQEAAGSIITAQASHVEEPPLLVQLLQTISPINVSQGPEANPAQLPKEGDVS